MLFVINFVLSIIFAQIIKRYIAKKYEKKQSILYNSGKLFALILSIAACAYIVRKIMKIIPKPVTKNVNPENIEQVRGTIMTGFSYFMFLGDELRSYLPLITIF